jgi:hypothetical protein
MSDRSDHERVVAAIEQAVEEGRISLLDDDEGSIENLADWFGSVTGLWGQE